VKTKLKSRDSDSCDLLSMFAGIPICHQGELFELAAQSKLLSWEGKAAAPGDTNDGERGGDGDGGDGDGSDGAAAMERPAMEMAAMETVAMETVAKENGDGTARHGMAMAARQRGKGGCRVKVYRKGEAPLYIPKHGGCQVLVGRQAVPPSGGPIPASMVPDQQTTHSAESLRHHCQ